MRVIEFSELVNGELIGNPDVVISGVSGITEAKAGDITFIASPGYLKYLPDSKASCLIVKDFIPDLSIPQIRISNPHYGFAKAIEIFYPKTAHSAGISTGAFISEESLIKENVAVYAFAYISKGVSIEANSVVMPGVFIGENTKIGRDCMIYPNVTIREGVTIGDRVIIHSGTVIGADGYGYVFENGEHYKIPQIGGVIIEDDVEIGANVCIDRATTGSTIVRKGTKIDNLSQIAHNVVIGEKVLVISQVGIAGSSNIGDYTVLGGKVGVADHTVIDAGTIIASGSGVMTGHVKKGVYSGYPARPHDPWLRSQAVFSRLPEMYKRLRELEAKIIKLEKEKDHD